ncbi:transposase domain-containing protein [Novosphingobium subterraneum]|uniref:transposase domain-containing protein n=1 Tax=Novosphingobium subterraneum TaxID=48936 RepID=UPI003D05A7A3
MQRHRFGRRSEQLDPDQFELALEEVETALAEAEHACAKASGAPAERPQGRASRSASRRFCRHPAGRWLWRLCRARPAA